MPLSEAGWIHFTDVDCKIVINEKLSAIKCEMRCEMKCEQKLKKNVSFEPGVGDWMFSSLGQEQGNYRDLYTH